MLLLYHVVILLLFAQFSFQSSGDRSPFYQKCLERCNLMNCTDDGLLFNSETKQLPLTLQLLQWTCNDECCYECMWKTVSAFQSRNWHIPQFYGKWPFYRILGIQEPASVVFSLMNLYMHLKMIKKFRCIIQPSCPLYGLWHFFTAVCVNAWIWSSVFHARDTPKTEILDYSSAFSIVLVSCYCMLYRFLYKAPRYMKVIMSTFFVAMFMNYVFYINLDKINYGFNMQLNLTIGGMTALGWFLWCTWNRYRQPYTWKCAAFISLTGLFSLLELIDRPPIYFILDFHSLWHLSSVPLVWLFYSFVIDDCKYLMNIEKLSRKTEDKNA